MYNSIGTIGWVQAPCLSLLTCNCMLDPQADLPNGTHSSAICVSEDHLLIYPDAASNALMVRDMDGRRTAGRLEGHDARIKSVAARGNLAVSTQVNGTRLWSLETMQCTATLLAMPDVWSTRCMEGRVLLGSAGLIKLLDVAASAPVPLRDLVGHTALVNCLEASASMVLSGSADKTVRLWDLRTSKCVRTMEGHSDAVCSVDMDGHCRTAVSGSFDKSAKLWDLGSGRCTETYRGHSSTVRDVIMHESGSSFMSAGRNDRIVNAWVVGSTKASMKADFKASCPLGGINRLFAIKDLSRVAYYYCCEGKLGVRYWK